MATESASADAPKMAATPEDVRAAAARIKPVAVRTPLLESQPLNEATGARILIKPECLQRTGSFKFRGAYNRLAQLSEPQRRAGIVAWSSGNHAQGVAAAAQLLDIPASIVMPSDAPAVKLEKTRGYGADIVPYDRRTQSREDIGRALAEERGAVLVPSFDDPDIIAGQGTTGWELFEQTAAIECELDAVLVCCGGGGLTAGIALVLAELSPRTEIFCVEPVDFDDHARSLKSGRRERNTGDAHSICDALLVPQPGELTFAINGRLLAGGLTVTDDEVAHAMRYAFSNLKLVVEPGGAVALAAALAGKTDLAGKTVGVILSGGNVDPSLFARVVTGA